MQEILRVWIAVSNLLFNLNVHHPCFLPCLLRMKKLVKWDFYRYKKKKHPVAITEIFMYYHVMLEYSGYSWYVLIHSFHYP